MDKVKHRKAFFLWQHRVEIIHNGVIPQFTSNLNGIITGTFLDNLWIGAAFGDEIVDNFQMTRSSGRVKNRALPLLLPGPATTVESEPDTK